MTSRIDKPSPNQNKKHCRKEPNKEPLHKIVIVTEDSVNAVAYFTALLKDLDLWQVKVTVDGSSDSTPEKVYDHALNTYKHIYTKPKRTVYCLIDRDDHDHYDWTLAQDKKIQNLRVLESVPNFELWILLHFQKSFANNNRKQLYQELKKHKVDKDADDYADVYEKKLKKETKTAVVNSEILLKQDRDSNPAYTKIHELMVEINALSGNKLRLNDNGT